MSSLMKPSEYAARYLPIMVPGAAEAYPIQVDRYHIGDPTAEQYRLWAAVGDYFKKKLKDSRYAFIEVVVNGMTLLFSDREHIRNAIINPFWGKGSPEECQITLQLALKLGLVQDTRLQQWANDNIGLDCNGFVGNYIFHEVMGRDWRSAARDNIDPGPKAGIDLIFKKVLERSKAFGGTDKGVTDLATVDPAVRHVIVRVDNAGHVIGGGPESLKAGNVGHIAITEPGQIIRPTPDGATLPGRAGKLALRTVESAGEVVDGVKRGVHQNWMYFLGPVAGLAGVFEVQRDSFAKIDKVRIAPLIDIS